MKPEPFILEAHKNYFYHRVKKDQKRTYFKIG